MAGNAGLIAVAFARTLLPGFEGKIIPAPEGLLVVSRRGGSALVRAPQASALPAAGATGALAVLAATVLEASRECDLVWAADSLLEPLPPRRPDEWLGFLRVASGWIGLAAVGSSALDLVRAVWTTVRGRTPARAARTLQELGIASLPAVAAGSVPEAARPSPPLLATVDGRPPPAVLAGVRILDLGRVVAAPFAAEVTRLLGADVKALRPPGYGADAHDLRTEAGRGRLRDLLRETDIVLENFRPRGWEQLIDPETAKLVPRRVALRGYPSSSPLRNWKVYGFLVESAFGIASPSLEVGQRVAAGRVPLWDRVTGVVAAAAAISLLRGQATDREVSQVALARRLRESARAA